MDISESADGGVVTLQLRGRFDAGTADGVKKRLLAGVSGQGVRLVIDFAQVVYISSIGLRVLLEVAKRVAVVKGRLVLCAMVSHVRQVFDLAGFASLIPICATHEEALTRVV